MMRTGNCFRIIPGLLWGVAVAVMSVGPDAHAAGVDPSAATPVQREQAQARFNKGKKLAAQKNFAEALVEYRASHDIVASPNTRLMIGRCLVELGRLVEAYAEFGRAVVEAQELKREDNRYAKAEESATAEREALVPKLGFATVTIVNARPETRLIVAGEEIRRAAWNEPIPIVPGSTELQVDTPGGANVRNTITVAAGKTVTLTVDAAPAAGAPAVTVKPTAVAPPPPSEPTNLRPWAYVAGGVGIAGIATFAIFGAKAKSTYSSLDDDCHGGPCSTDRSNDINAGKRDQTIANIGLVVGAVGLATGVTLFVLSKPKSASSTHTAVVVSPSWIGVQGQL